MHPIVGVRHQAVERLVARLCNEKFREYQSPTVATPIGYVMPERRDIVWEFGGEHGMAASSEFVTAVISYGVPFMRSLRDPEAIESAINRSFSESAEYHLPAILEVMGRHSEAKVAMDCAVDKLGGRDDAAAQRLRGFAAAFYAETATPASSSHEE
jgi:hypothetical protein